MMSRNSALDHANTLLWFYINFCATSVLISIFICVYNELQLAFHFILDMPYLDCAYENFIPATVLMAEIEADWAFWLNHFLHTNLINSAF